MGGEALASRQMTLNHSGRWASLAVSSPLPHLPFLHPHFPSPLYIHGAFSTLLPPQHTHTHTRTHFLWMEGMGVMSSLCSDGTLLHASLPHKFALIDSRRSHMLTNRSFWGRECECVCGWMCVRPLCAKHFVTGQQHCTHQHSNKWLHHTDNNKMVTVANFGALFCLCAHILLHILNL